MNRNAFPAPKVDGLISALVDSGMSFTPEVTAALRARLDSLLFQRPRWWGAWQASAMSGRELRDAVLQHAHFAIEKFTGRKVAFDHFGSLETRFELVLFGGRLVGDEPGDYDGRIG